MISMTLAQINPTLGDLDGNAEKILSVWAAADSDLVVFPELVLSGYPPEDLITNPNFINAIERHVKVICDASGRYGAGALLTCPWRIDGKIYNATLLIHGGEILSVTRKHHLPNYGVFDEVRVFEAGGLPDVVSFKGCTLGVMICEDMWYDDVATHLKAQGAQILIIPNGSPWYQGKGAVREDLAAARVCESGLPLVYVNQIGGQDELVFDGGSFVMDEHGTVTQRLRSFEEDVAALGAKSSGQDLEPLAAIYAALTLGLSDYVEKNGFPGVLIGLSGGIDSALTAAIAVDALGADRVQCVMMPSPFTSDDSLYDAEHCAAMLGVSYDSYPIKDAMDAFEGTIKGLSGIAHENMQSRSRGLILMALSNASGKMVVTTGNKSEMAVGYATLYGDMNGGFNALKDVYKTQVYALSRWRNEQGMVIPERIITKAPSAELRDDQTDQDSLPEYDVLDDILTGLIKNEDSFAVIAARGHDMAVIEQVARLLRLSEYKRYQAPPGTKITTRAFGRDRRYPMTNKYKFD
ncbi:MAG: NAD+ synthase [Alphaproteobacteria bacterium]|nr:NAD+ synthase [Alphaproteobacteria bacterium]